MSSISTMYLINVYSEKKAWSLTIYLNCNFLEIATIHGFLFWPFQKSQFKYHLIILGPLMYWVIKIYRYSFSYSLAMILMFHFYLVILCDYWLIEISHNCTVISILTFATHQPHWFKSFPWGLLQNLILCPDAFLFARVKVVWFILRPRS